MFNLTHHTVKINARKELTSKLIGRGIMAAIIWIYDPYNSEYDKLIILRTDHSKSELISLFNALDFEYDDTFQSHLVSGCFWFKNGTSLERNYSDTTNCWVHNNRSNTPLLPDECLPWQY